MLHLSLQRRSAERGLSVGIFFEGIDLLMASAEGRGTRANPFFLPAPKCSFGGGLQEQALSASVSGYANRKPWAVCFLNYLQKLLQSWHLGDTEPSVPCRGAENT